MLNSPEPRRASALRLIRFLRLVYAVPLGLAIAGVVGGFVLDYGWYIAAGSVGFSLAIMALTLGSVARSMRGNASPQSMRFVQQHGDRALAKIERLKTTGAQVNDAYVTELKLVVAPPDETAYRATARELIHPVRSAAYQPGTVVVVRHSPRYPGVVAVDADPPREWTQRPWQAGIIGEERTPEPEARLGNAVGRLAMTVVSTVVVAVALLVPIRDDVLGQLISPPDLFSAEDLRAGIAKLSAESERFEDLTVEPDQLRATIPGAYLSYRGGTVKRDSSGAGKPDKQFAANEVNFAAIPGLVASFGGDPADARVSVRREDVGITMTVRSANDGNRQLVADAQGVPALTADAFTENGFRQVAESLTKLSGRPEAYEAIIRADHVEFQVPGPGPGTSDDYDWYRGRLVEHRPSPIQPDPGAPLFALSELSPKALPAILAKVNERMPGFPRDKVSVALRQNDGTWSLTTSVQDEYGRGIEVTASPDGSTVAVMPTR
ncbi:hypothetical protein L3Q65_03550 [Amycolatopsis sp. FU40]|uniref:hypothetical protein n=1 Tax=Amycolatopsis sp. FU40 TaxID=2914159 RepID=UPI001F2FADC8|nr:hypothetical protein [Amycolatopsis sp. FU40]UKD55809.1 hypothetical protein L3Q65_03550 [Amycolatopsis sp. FU40]